MKHFQISGDGEALDFTLPKYFASGQEKMSRKRDSKILPSYCFGQKDKPGGQMGGRGGAG